MDGLTGSTVGPTTTRAAARSALIGRTATFVAFSLAFTLLGGFVANALPISRPMIAIASLAGLACALLLAWLRAVPVVNLGLMYGLAFSMGLVVGPAIDVYVRAGYAGLVYEAIGLTAVLTLGLGAYALTTKRDFSRLEDHLFFALLGLVAVGVASRLLGIPYPQLGLSLVGALVFCGYILVDVRKARDLEDTVGNAVLLAVNVYLDILNLFLYLLQLLGGGSSDD